MACDRFEAAWQAALAGGSRPHIEDHLRGVADASRLALLRELVLLDVHYRGQTGEQPCPEDYRPRFAELSQRWLARKIRPGQATTQGPPPPTASAQPETTAPGANRLRCPHCHNPIQLADDHVDEVLPGPPTASTRPAPWASSGCSSASASGPSGPCGRPTTRSWIASSP
jgi:hypothetical protein